MIIITKVKYFFIKKYLNYKYRQFIFKIANSDSELSQMYKLRYDAYCDEYGYFNKTLYPDNSESDEFDKHSTHFIALNKNNKVVGSIRLIHNSELGLRLEDYVELPNVDLSKISELSRLVVDKNYRNSGHVITLGLCKEAYRYSFKKGTQYWCGTMFLFTMKIFYRMQFFFTIIGKLDFWPKGSNNPIYPVFFDLKDTAIYLKEKNPKLYNFFTHDGYEFNINEDNKKNDLNRISAVLRKQKLEFFNNFNKYHK